MCRKVASARYIDIIPLAVNHELVRGITRDIQNTMYDTLVAQIPPAGLDSLDIKPKKLDSTLKYQKLQEARRKIVELLESEDVVSDSTASESSTGSDGSESEYDSCTTS